LRSPRKGGRLHDGEGAASRRTVSLSNAQINEETASEYEAAARLAGEFFVRGVEIIARAHDGDLLKGIIFTAIAVANQGGATATASPQAARPVSVMSVASSIGVPYETTRRYVNLLVSQGLCERMGRSGVVVSQEGLMTPAMLTAYQETVTSFNRLATALRRLNYAAVKA
jgi:hypothetical protein